MLPIFEWLSTLPLLEKVIRFPVISKLAMPKKTDPTGVGLLQKFAEEAIRRRREEKHNDMLTVSLDGQARLRSSLLLNICFGQPLTLSLCYARSRS